MGGGKGIRCAYREAAKRAGCPLLDMYSMPTFRELTYQAPMVARRISTGRSSKREHASNYRIRVTETFGK